MEGAVPGRGECQGKGRGPETAESRVDERDAAFGPAFITGNARNGTPPNSAVSLDLTDAKPPDEPPCPTNESKGSDTGSDISKAPTHNQTNDPTGHQSRQAPLQY